MKKDLTLEKQYNDPSEPILSEKWLIILFLKTGKISTNPLSEDCL